MSGVSVHTVAAMGTVVTFQVVGHDEDAARAAARDAGIARAAGWFHTVESCCSRFDRESELRRLSAAPIGTAVPASAMLFEAVRFALSVAEESGGAFDPTIGLAMEAAGFDRHHRSGETVRAMPGACASSAASYRDVALDASRHTVTLMRPLVFDLGAVAKGLAVDMAARELAPFRHFAIDAGGDLFLSGHNQDRAPWTVGIRHPRRAGDVIETLRVSDAAVCTSGDYERPGPADAGGHHLLHPATGRAATTLASVTVIAGSAMVADALATAAFVLGPVDGLRLLTRSGVEGLLLTPALERAATPGFAGIASPR